MGKRKLQFLVKDLRLAYPKSATTNMDAVKLMNELIPDNENSMYNVESLEGSGLGHIDIEGKE